MEQKLSPQTANQSLNQWAGLGLSATGALLLWFWLSPAASANWWASFILLPAVALLGMVPLVQSHSPFTANLFKGSAFIIATIAGMFLLDLNWAVYWPLVIVSPGVATFFMGAAAVTNSPIGRAVAGSTRWLGFTVLMLGVTFQMSSLAIITLSATTPFPNWWSSFIALFGVGLAINALKLHRATGRSAATMTFYILTGWTFLSAVLEGIGYNWNHWQLLVGTILVSIGLAQMLSSQK